MICEDFTKDPQETLDYAVDWTRWLLTDVIVGSTWTVPAGITMSSETETAKVATIWLSGGTLGEDYVIVNQITTAAGRISERSMTISIRSK